MLALIVLLVLLLLRILEIGDECDQSIGRGSGLVPGYGVPEYTLAMTDRIQVLVPVGCGSSGKGK